MSAMTMRQWNTVVECIAGTMMMRTCVLKAGMATEGVVEVNV